MLFADRFSVTGQKPRNLPVLEKIPCSTFREFFHNTFNLGISGGDL
jgi:hypothetical protein